MSRYCPVTRDERFYVPLSGRHRLAQRWGQVSDSASRGGRNTRSSSHVRHTLGLDHSVGSVAGHWLYIHSEAEELFTCCKYLSLSALRVYVRKYKWYTYLYVNKRLELAQRGIALYKIMYFYIFIIINCLY